MAGRAKEAVEFLVATAKAWPGAPDGTGDDTPLHLAARSGDVELARVFLKAVGGSSSELLKDKNKRGLTPLGEALLLPVSRSCSTASAAAVAAAAAGKDHGDKSNVSPSSSSQAISKEGLRHGRRPLRSLLPQAAALLPSSGRRRTAREAGPCSTSSAPPGALRASSGCLRFEEAKDLVRLSTSAPPRPLAPWRRCTPRRSGEARRSPSF